MAGWRREILAGKLMLPSWAADVTRWRAGDGKSWQAKPITRRQVRTHQVQALFGEEVHKANRIIMKLRKLAEKQRAREEQQRKENRERRKKRERRARLYEEGIAWRKWRVSENRYHIYIYIYIYI